MNERQAKTLALSAALGCQGIAAQYRYISKIPRINGWLKNGFFVTNILRVHSTVIVDLRRDYKVHGFPVSEVAVATIDTRKFEVVHCHQVVDFTELVVADLGPDLFIGPLELHHNDT